METIVIVNNLGCNGCVNTISKTLLQIKGIEFVSVNINEHTVTVTHQKQVLKQDIADTLLNIGYPEVATDNGILTQLKSIKSCMAGKFSN